MENLVHGMEGRACILASYSSHHCSLRGKGDLLKELCMLVPIVSHVFLGGVQTRIQSCLICEISHDYRLGLIRFVFRES